MKKQRFSACVILVIAFVGGVSTLGQIPGSAVPPAKDVDDLFLRASASDIVVVGTVTRSAGVGRRLSEADFQERTQPAPDSRTVGVRLDGLHGGSLFEVQIEEILCRSQDFQPHAAKPAATPQESVVLFVPQDEPLWRDGRRREFLLRGETYLLFLVEVDLATRQKWASLYELDAGQPLFRSHERSRGAILLREASQEGLTPDQPPILAATAQLCHAVRPQSLEEKLARLAALATSEDPVLQREARAATQALQAPTQPKD